MNIIDQTYLKLEKKEKTKIRLLIKEKKISCSTFDKDRKKRLKNVPFVRVIFYFEILGLDFLQFFNYVNIEKDRYGDSN